MYSPLAEYLSPKTDFNFQNKLYAPIELVHGMMTQKGFWKRKNSRYHMVASKSLLFFEPIWAGWLVCDWCVTDMKIMYITMWKLERIGNFFTANTSEMIVIFFDVWNNVAPLTISMHVPRFSEIPKSENLDLWKLGSMSVIIWMSRSIHDSGKFMSLYNHCEVYSTEFYLMDQIS